MIKKFFCRNSQLDNFNGKEGVPTRTIRYKATSDHIDFSNIPLPDIPTKKKMNRGKTSHKNSLLSLENSILQSKNKRVDNEHFKKIHYRETNSNKKQSHMFANNVTSTLNQSEWKQDSNCDFKIKNISSELDSKIERLISHNEERKTQQKFTESVGKNIINVKTDCKRFQDLQKVPSDRPGFLPVKSSLGQFIPPPTPILSPPPGFQDQKIRNQEAIKKRIQIQVSVTDTDNNKTMPAQIAKGMVFSRSFEDDSRKTIGFNEKFSRSFDFDLQSIKNKGKNKNFLSKYGESTAFTSLTGNSPNYLTKKEKPPDTKFPKLIPVDRKKSQSVFNAKSGSLEKSYKDFLSSRHPVKNGYRNQEERSSFIDKRLNSCDSGARSGKINLFLRGKKFF